jgi:hypothetical protein
LVGLLAFCVPLVIAVGVAFACNPQAHLTLDRTSLTPGQTITVYGSYFPSNADVTVSGPGGSKIVRTSAGGSFATTFQAPSQAGSYVIGAVRSTGGFASAAFVVIDPATYKGPPSQGGTRTPSLTGVPATTGLPPRLTRRQAARDVKVAVRARFGSRTGRPKCKRSTRLRFSCRARWTDGTARYAAAVLIVRSGPRTSPIDRYRIKARSTGRRGRARVRRVRGRVLVSRRHARLGQTLRLVGMDETTDIEVTPGPLIEPFPADDLHRPPFGTRLVAIQLRITDRAKRGYGEALTMSTRLITSAKTLIAPTSVHGCTGFVDVPSGSTRIGCVAFAVPDRLAASALEYRANARLGVELGTWTLR